VGVSRCEKKQDKKTKRRYSNHLSLSFSGGKRRASRRTKEILRAEARHKREVRASERFERVFGRKKNRPLHVISRFTGSFPKMSSSYGTIPTPPSRKSTSDASLATAKSAYQSGDAELSRSIHDGKRGGGGSRRHHSSADEAHSAKGGDLLKAMVFGGIDGVLTSCAMVTGATGGNLSPLVVLVLGASNMMADAVSMGIGDYVSTWSYRDHVAEERKREEWEFEEMVDLYVQRGLPRDKAVEVVATMAKYKDFFIDLMVIEELGLKVPDKNDLEPWKSGLATATSFFVFGSIPLILYAIMLHRVTPRTLFVASSISTLVVLFALGAIKSRFSVVSWWKSGGEFVMLGGAVAAMSYWISSMVSGWV
jgi:VIT1/CCC1 family predicted Fe2+/Mn2+ transporter